MRNKYHHLISDGVDKDIKKEISSNLEPKLKEMKKFYAEAVKERKKIIKSAENEALIKEMINKEELMSKTINNIVSQINHHNSEIYTNYVELGSALGTRINLMKRKIELEQIKNKNEGEIKRLKEIDDRLLNSPTVEEIKAWAERINNLASGKPQEEI
jgi:hypothetical protein